MTFLFIIFGYVFFDDKVVDDEVLALHGVLAHVVFQKFRHLVALAQCHLLQAYVGTDEVLELVRTYLAKYEMLRLAA